MSNESHTSSNRREFLSGQALRRGAENLGNVISDEILSENEEFSVPTGGATIHLSTRAMACDFSVIMNPGPGTRTMHASDALDLVHTLEEQLTVFRETSELSHLNRKAFQEVVEVEQQLFDLLLEAGRICRETGGGFDPTSGPLINLWKQARQENRIPFQIEIEECLDHIGLEHLAFQEEFRRVRFNHPKVKLDLGGIGKGYALDRAGKFLRENEEEDWLIHGGHSSILARGDHNQCGGWPVGIRNPLFPKQRLATVLLQNCALSSSGSGVQHFRHAKKRYGHILDPRSGWPVEGMLSVTVLAPTAAEADALSTAFFVIGVENARRYCDNTENVSALLIPPPRAGRRLEPINCGIPEGVLYYTPEETASKEN